MYWQPNMYNYVCYGLHHRSYVCTPWPGTKDSVFLSWVLSQTHESHQGSEWLLLETARSHKKDIADRCPGGFPGKTVYVTLCMYVCMYACSMASRLVMPDLFTLVLWRNRKLGRHRRCAHIWCDGMQWIEKGKDTYVCMHVCMYVCMYVRVYVCLNVVYVWQNKKRVATGGAQKMRPWTQLTYLCMYACM